MNGFTNIPFMLILLAGHKIDGREAQLEKNVYKPVRSDKFEKDSPSDPDKWRFEQGFKWNEEVQWYPSENATCKNGYFVITGKKEHQPNPAKTTV